MPMPEIAYQDQNTSSRSGFRAARDASPDSVIFSLFSSASASVDRCSFASDASEISLHLAAHEGGGVVVVSDHHETSSGPDRKNPDPNKSAPVTRKSKKQQHNTTHTHAHTRTRLSRKAEKEKAKAAAAVQKNLDDIITDDNSTTTTATTITDYDNNQLPDSARSSFSLAIKECQERRSRSEALSKKLDRRRPASLDLNNVVSASSPRLGNAKKSSAILSTRRSGNFPSPGTPNYRHASVGMPKGWSSERVPLQSSSNRRQLNNSGCVSMAPFNNGRTLPSKWEDAERWIFSPVSGEGTGKATSSSSLQQPQRRPKSKSGPLGPPGVAYYSLYSPVVPVFDGGNVGSFIAGSPFSAGVIAADKLNMRSSAHGVAFPVRNEPCMARSVSVHGCSEMLGQSSLPPQDEKTDGLKDAATDISRAVSRRDMATQMSPEGSIHSSPPSGRASFSACTPSALPIVEVQSVHSSKSEVRDVPVDEKVTVTRWSKKCRARNHGKSSEIVDDWRKKAVDARPWDVSEAAKSISKSKREEARISAWENLQKAKAEAAIRKLEMKLEKKRSSSMDKIMNKLRSAQKRAQEMRSSVLTNQAHQISTSHKAISFRRTRQMGSLSGCFTCHAF
ncbi:hypothetical protein Tsubulata_001741 [Turnera subulata]|uniref:Remorin C-terminal domain-containing protein n=1 Tax=Turnera subulata TaxID=218843 RepID=A0A9Q0G3L5_9ROSI|nr:hypothetical protein Tsubulata_001741 [Turnera subulata]